MKSNGECKNNDVALMILREDFNATDVTLGSYQVQGERRHELNMKWQG